MKPIIQLKNVTVRYDVGKTNEFTAIKDINLEIYEGEYIVFFGPSGCGKSTLLYTIAGLESPTLGEVVVGGNNLKVIKPNDLINFYRDTIGMVFQAFYLVPHLSAKDNMMLSKMFSGVPVDEREKRAKLLMDKFGITPYADNKPSMMSGGQQQRTAIARALMNDPEIILADEPVGNLDSKNSFIVLELLAQINREDKKTVIQVTHNANDTHYADRVFYLKDGVLERVVVNTNKGRTLTGKDGEQSEFDKLAANNPDLSRLRIHAKLLMRTLLMPYDIDTEQKIEISIEDYISKKITKQELVKILDDEKIGAGLYSQKAKRIANTIFEASDEIEKVEKIVTTERAHETKQVNDEVSIIRKHLLDQYRGKVSLSQVRKLDKFIGKRIRADISDKELLKLLDESEKLGGVGLNRLTARRFSREIELVISK
ncbi:MAG: ABC transporter ATP-binding protein [Candidatus Taylorbacteria bacterium]